MRISLYNSAITIHLKLNTMRIREYVVFLYRIFLVYLFYAIARALFIYFNHGEMGDYNLSDLFYYGLAFDNCAIMYTNLLFILLSLFPLWINTHKNFQKVVFWSYLLRDRKSVV